MIRHHDVSILSIGAYTSGRYGNSQTIAINFDYPFQNKIARKAGFQGSCIYSLLLNYFEVISSSFLALITCRSRPVCLALSP